MPKMSSSAFVMPFADQINKALNGFVETASGTTSATVTVLASDYRSNNGHKEGAALALTDLIITGTGAGTTLTVLNGTRTLFSVKTGGGLVTLGFNTLPITDRGVDLVIQVTGATADASITALGFAA
jgi:hypothetical protein